MDAQTSLAVVPHFTLREKDRAQYHAAVNCLKAAAGLPVTPGRPIRELLREESFEADLACALGSPILETWPLTEQLGFLDRIGSMQDAAKRVHIYAQVYQLYRDAAASK
ncbi:MAG: hypothetical protein ACOY5B_10890 [Spirochaetota bacterium]